MTAVFTYKKPSRQIYNFPVDQYKWIVKAISAAKEVGYNTCLYTDDQEFAQGLVLDELHFISDEYNIWDSFKIHVLENRTSTDYFLCDNDCIFHSYLKFDDKVDTFVLLNSQDYRGKFFSVNDKRKKEHMWLSHT